MAQYDGSVRINTKIETKEASAQLMSLENRMKKTADKVAGLRSKLDSLKSVKVPTQEYQEIQKQIEATEKKINDLMARQEKFLATGGKESSSAYKRMQYDLDELKNSMPYLRGELESLVEEGKAFTLGNPEEIAKTEQQLKYAENDLAVLNRRHDELAAKQNKASDGCKRLGDAAKRAASVFGKMKNTAVSALRKIGSATLSVAKGSFKLLGAAAKNAFSHIAKGAKKSGGLMGNFASRLKGITLSLLVFNWITKAFNAMVSSIKAGFGNLYNENERFKSSVNGLKASLATLQNAFAAAFRPLVEIAIPYIQKAVEWVTRLLDAVGQLIAALAGRKTYTKAVRQTAAGFEDTAAAAKKAEKAVEGYLSPLDEINKFNKKNEDEAGSGAGGGAGGGPMFEEIPVSDQFRNIAQWFKDMWAAADFYGLGQYIGGRLKEALDSIPWDEVKATARKIGKSLATLINGFIEVEGLGYSVGRTLAEAFNTGFEFLNAFVHELHWDSLGRFIAERLNGIFENIDWPLIQDTFITGAKGLGDAANSFVDYLNWPAIANAISNFVNTFTDTVYTFFTTVDWPKLGGKVGTLISDSIAGIDWYKTGQALGAGIQAALDFLLEAVGNINWGDIGTRIAYLLNGAVSSIDLSAAGQALGRAVTGLCETAINFAKTFDWKGLGDNISGGINGFFEKFDGAALGKAATSLLSRFLDMVMRAAETTDWEAIGRDVVDFLANINWLELGIKLFGAAADIIGGLVSGLIKAIANTDWGQVWRDILDAFKEFFGIHSPSTVMEEMGGHIVDGLLNGLKNTWGSVARWIEEKVGWIIGRFRSINAELDSISGSFSRTAADIGLKNISFRQASPYADIPGIAALANMDIPGYATGQVIPRNMRRHLAILGDNNRETEVVSPVSTIEDAVVSGIKRAGGITGNANITVQIMLDRKVVGQAVLEYGKLQQMATGRNPFELGTT